eukprot:TRINITY_DN457_c0_g1_i6.p1 TRINITY_DN457_c0_g1~~TRINITY_DN457_c0_g1_i6.p1  ORF type:complete len:212 (-),score=73.16 TRINITY_DN457_c0_g1_i6:39-674(-)
MKENEGMDGDGWGCYTPVTIVEREDGLQVDEYKFELTGRGELVSMPLLASGVGAMKMCIKWKAAEEEQGGERMIVGNDCRVSVEGSMFQFTDDVVQEALDVQSNLKDAEHSWLDDDEGCVEEEVEQVQRLIDMWNDVKGKQGVDQVWQMINMSSGTGNVFVDGVVWSQGGQGVEGDGRQPVMMEHVHVHVPVRVTGRLGEAEEVEVVVRLK